MMLREMTWGSLMDLPVIKHVIGLFSQHLAQLGFKQSINCQSQILNDLIINLYQQVVLCDGYREGIISIRYTATCYTALPQTTEG
jgi:hypothetical protein